MNALRIASLQGDFVGDGDGSSVGMLDGSDEGVNVGASVHGVDA